MPHGDGRFRFPGSRDFMLDQPVCAATKCVCNSGGYCFAPSRAEIGDDGRCKNFKKRIIKPGIQIFKDCGMSSVKRLYDDKRRKRQVYVMITSWRGVSVGAKHFYAKVHEDDNPVVVGDLFHYDSEDKDCKGRVFGGMLETSFHSYAVALDWVVDIINEHFPSNTHKLWDCSGLVTMKDVREALKDGKDRT